MARRDTKAGFTRERKKQELTSLTITRKGGGIQFFLPENKKNSSDNRRRVSDGIKKICGTIIPQIS
jgi:hypothetical protein